MCALVTGVQTCALPIFQFVKPIVSFVRSRYQQNLLKVSSPLIAALTCIESLCKSPTESLVELLHEAKAFVFLLELDRKSVVEGKSVSVRVDHGGRRSMKKKIIRSNTKSSKKQHK